MLERPFAFDDLPALAEIYIAAIHALAAPFYTKEQLSTWAPSHVDLEKWRSRLAPFRTIVAEENGVMAGFVSYSDGGYVDFLFTHPAFARRGVATRLYLLAEESVKAAGVSQLCTHASLAARPFFQHHGFVVDAEELSECRGVYLRRFAMHKNV